MDWIACWLLTCLQMKILLMVGQDKLKAGLSSCPPDLVVAIETSSMFFLFFFLSIFLYYYLPVLFHSFYSCPSHPSNFYLMFNQTCGNIPKPINQVQLFLEKNKKHVTITGLYIL